MPLFASGALPTFDPILLVKGADHLKSAKGADHLKSEPPMPGLKPP